MNAETIDRPESKALAPIEVLRTQLEERAKEFAMVLPVHITPAKLQRTVLTAAQSNPALLACERRSFLTSCMKAAQDGLLPDGREAAIVPFNHRYKDEDGWHSVKMAQYMPMVFGLRKKILQSGEITDIFAAVVYRQELEGEHPHFIYEEGSERTLRHKPILSPDFRPKDEDIVLAYSVATFANGFKSFEVMRRWEIDEVREVSQTGATLDSKGKPRDAKGPWVDWFGEMAKKTVMRRHSKSLPQSGDIVTDVEAEDMGFAGRSTVALLASRPPDAPQRDLIVDSEGDSYDAATGELVPDEDLTPEERGTSEGGDGPAPEPETRPLDPPPPTPTENPAPAEYEPADEPEPLPTEDTEGPGEIEDARAMHERLGDEFIGRAKRVEFITDLRNLSREVGKHIALMPPDIAAAVDQALGNARLRVGQKQGDAS